MKKQEAAKLSKAHNPKVGGSNPSPAIERRPNKPPFLFGLQTALFIEVLEKSGAKSAIGGKTRPERSFDELSRLFQVIHVPFVVMLIGRRHPLVSELNSRQFETDCLTQVLARRSAECMKSVCARRAFDAAPVEDRIQHFPSQIVRIRRARIIIGSTKYEIVRSDIFAGLEMLRQNTLEAFRHVPDLLLAGLR